ncbi:WD repeat-containing protein 25 isoform X2 [Thalassophryne amazonica]|nr:WD repeat-containing protein 25 isoform X2 [Thalassophryne amazonica]
MSALVAYDDSESEDDTLNQSETGGSSCVHTGSKVGVCNLSEITPVTQNLTVGSDTSALETHGTVSETSTSSRLVLSQTQTCFSRDIKCSVGWTGQDVHARDTGTPLNSPGIVDEISAVNTLFHMPQNFDNGSKHAKRHHAALSGVRPYIPKRQRLATSVKKVDPGDFVPGNQTRESQILSEVSVRVKSYLTQKPVRAGIPKRPLMSLGGHQGPVNVVKWCPVPHLSHLLLSASMDKTFRVWDGAESGRCLRVYACHSEAVRDACWTPCGQLLLTGSFDNTAAITDVQTGQQVVKMDNQSKVMCVVFHPANPNVFLCGGYSSAVKAWDSRCSKVVNVYKAGIQQTLDILFLKGGAEFITSSDCVSRDSADRTLIAWDYQTTAKVSNQIYHERYTCPSLALHPVEESFVVQTNGNYMALFSSQKPYKMNKRRRYEGHKVEGYAVRCDFSTDGTILASGSSTGAAHFYDYDNVRMLHTLPAHSQPCLGVSQHPILPATVATCDWAGEIKIWH